MLWLIFKNVLWDIYLTSIDEMVNKFHCGSQCAAHGASFFNGLAQWLACTDRKNFPGAHERSGPIRGPELLFPVSLVTVPQYGCSYCTLLRNDVIKCFFTCCINWLKLFKCRLWRWYKNHSHFILNHQIVEFSSGMIWSPSFQDYSIN